MPNFDSINQEINNINAEIKKAEVEMDFSKTSNKNTDLRIKPIYLVCLVVLVFFVELITGIAKGGYKPNLWLICPTVACVVIYVVYFIVNQTKIKKQNEDNKKAYLEKKDIYEILCKKKIAIADDFANTTNGIKLQSAEDNSLNYLWFENDILYIARLGVDLNPIEIHYSDIKYISSDERLFDYNKLLGTATMVNDEIPYCYIFTVDNCYRFHTNGYDQLCELLPEKELLKVLEIRKKSID